MKRSSLFAVGLICLIVATSSCGPHEETIGSVKIPIPAGMTRSQESGIEVSLLGFGGAQASYQGKLAPEKVIDFYRTEMTARDWKPSFGLLSKGGMLTYVKDSTTVIITIGKTDAGTHVTITAGGTQR